jgi:hypothetical protein
MTQRIELTGLDGSNPLAFLAALGTVRLADRIYGREVKIGWKQDGRWIPVLEVPDAIGLDCLVIDLHKRLFWKPEADLAVEEKKQRKLRDISRKNLEKAEKELKARKLKGEERKAVYEAEIAPLREQVERDTQAWRVSLRQAVPVFYLSLGQKLDVSGDRYAKFTKEVAASLTSGEQPDREDADFAAAFGCEACLTEFSLIEPTRFQFITGKGHQFFLETISDLMEEITPDKLRRTIKGPWTMEDRRLSFRWGPDEDRRYAYSWDNPSDGDGVPSEHGANLLAAMALPLFPSMPVKRQLVSTAIRLTEQSGYFTWPIWEPFIGIDVIRSILASQLLRESKPVREQLRPLGVIEVYRSQRIWVGSGLKARLNLTPAVAV